MTGLKLMTGHPDGPYLLAVGDRYGDKRSFQEGFNYNFRDGAHELLISLPGLRANEIDAVARGECEFGVAVDGPIIFFLWRFGREFPWSDAPYSVWLVPTSQRTVPQPQHLVEPHALLTIILISSETAIVRALRVTTLSPALTAALHLAIRDQHTNGWCGQALFDRALGDAYGRFPTTQAMVAQALATSKGGA